MFPQISHTTFHTVIVLAVWGLLQEVAEWLDGFEQSVEAAMHGLAYSVALESFHNWVSLQMLIQFSGSVETVSLLASLYCCCCLQAEEGCSQLINELISELTNYVLI